MPGTDFRIGENWNALQFHYIRAVTFEINLKVFGDNDVLEYRVHYQRFFVCHFFRSSLIDYVRAL